MEALKEITQLSEYYLDKTGRPLVSLCYAQSLDGSISNASKRPLELSGSDSMIFTHKLRAVHDAILVGIGTVLTDDPQLTVRLVEGKNPQPVILDSRCRTPVSSYLMQGHPVSPWIAITEKAPPSRRSALEIQGARLLELKCNTQGNVNLDDLMRKLAEFQVRSLMVEGGSSVITSVLSQKLVDHVILTISPQYIAGNNVLNQDFLKEGLEDLRLIEPEVQTMGNDVVIWGRITVNK